MIDTIKAETENMNSNNKSFTACEIVANKLGLDFNKKPLYIVNNGKNYAFSCSPVTNNKECRQYYPNLEVGIIWLDWNNGDVYLIEDKHLKINNSPNRISPKHGSAYTAKFDLKNAIKL